MKARKKNSNGEWIEVKYVQLDNSDILYKQEYLEFDAISPELKTDGQIANESHWQNVRERSAIAAMQGLINAFSLNTDEEKIAFYAIKQADALIEQLKKK